MARKRVELSKELLETALNTTQSAYQAYLQVKQKSDQDVTYTTFIRRCREFGIYKTNMGLKGTKKPNPRARIPLEKVFSGEHFMFGQGLKKKMLQAGLLEDRCSICGILPEWQGKPLTLQLDHIDGDRTNNSQANLRIVCPNCHAQTPTFSKGQFRKKEHADVAKLVEAQR